MQVRFANYKKVYLILGAFIVFIIGLYIASEIFSRNKKESGPQVINSGIYPQSKSGASQGGAGSQELTTVIEFLKKKSDILISSLLNSDVSYRNDPVFQNINEKAVFGDLLQQLSQYEKPVKTELERSYSDPNGNSAAVYLRVYGSNKLPGKVLEFIYSHDDVGGWKLSKVKIRGY